MWYLIALFALLLFYFLEIHLEGRKILQSEMESVELQLDILYVAAGPYNYAVITCLCTCIMGFPCWIYEAQNSLSLSLLCLKAVCTGGVWRTKQGCVHADMLHAFPLCFFVIISSCRHSQAGSFFIGSDIFFLTKELWVRSSSVSICTYSIPKAAGAFKLVHAT